MLKNCPICRQQVPVYQWAAHEMSHRMVTQIQPASLLGPGPMPQQPVMPHPAAPYPAVAQPAALPYAAQPQPPQPQPQPQPIQQAVAKAPRVYHHPRCGHATAMPESAIYAQVQDPFSTSDQAYCSGCRGYIGTSELFWEGTSESLLASDRRQKAEFIRVHGLNPNDFVWDTTGPARRKSKSNFGMLMGVGIGALALVLLLAVGLTIGLAVLFHRRQAAPANPFPMQQAANPPGAPVAPRPAMPPRVIRDGVPPWEDLQARHDDVFAEMRKAQEEMEKEIERMRPDHLVPPAGLGPPPAGLVPPPGLGPPVTGPAVRVDRGGIPGPPRSGFDPAADARKRIEEIREKSKQRREEARERLRSKSP